jgi:hypothetical protein
MAKKSKANQIRAYITANPETPPVEVAKKFNAKVQYVYVLRSLLKKEAMKSSVPASAGPVVAPREIVAEPMKDMVNKPPHYTDGGMEVIDFIEAKRLDYHLGNVVKYITRAGKKDDELQDLQKARWYLDRAISARHEAIINCDGPT